MMDISTVKDGYIGCYCKFIYIIYFNESLNEKILKKLYGGNFDLCNRR